MDYFNQFGSIDEVQITQAHAFENDPSKVVNRHCYVKFHSDDDADKCLFHPKHSIGNGEIKVARTYRIGEHEDTDKKIFVKIMPAVQNIEEV